MLFKLVAFYTLSLFVSSFFSENWGIICAIISSSYLVAQAIYDVNDDDDDD